jgi:hypothetical protein
MGMVSLITIAEEMIAAQELLQIPLIRFDTFDQICGFFSLSFPR